MKSLRKAIDGHCRGCIYDPKSGMGTWREQVEACAITKCELWEVRPLSRPRKRTGGETPPALLAYRLAKQNQQA